MNIANKYRLIVFDWEGTLAEDSIGNIFHVINQYMLDLNLPSIDRDTLLACLDLGLAYTVNHLFPNLSMHKQEEILSSVNDVLSRSANYVFLMPDALSLIEKLTMNGIDLAIATNKREASLCNVLRLSGLDNIFKIYRCPGLFQAKPCPDMLLDIINVFNESADATLMIGDSVTDVEMAQAANVDVIGLDVYHQNKHELLHAGALNVFDSFQQIMDFLEIR